MRYVLQTDKKKKRVRHNGGNTINLLMLQFSGTFLAY